jgi:HEAT repeat protein
LRQALTSSNTRTRDAIMQVLIATRDERAAPLFVYILEHCDHRGRLAAMYLAAVETLGKLGGGSSTVDALRRVLYRGDWWAPVRTRRLRRAAAEALVECGSTEARDALERAAGDGPRRVRRLARAALTTAHHNLQRAAGRPA